MIETSVRKSPNDSETPLCHQAPLDHLTRNHFVSGSPTLFPNGKGTESVWPPEGVTLHSLFTGDHPTQSHREDQDDNVCKSHETGGLSVLNS